jgi:hypothetical protein
MSSFAFHSIKLFWNFLLLGAVSLIVHAQPVEFKKSHMPTTPVQGPEWREFVVFGLPLQHSEVQTVCHAISPTAKQNATFLGCARISFVLRRCHYVYEAGNAEARAHERAHCSGFDHEDGSPLQYELNMQQAWSNLRQQYSQRIQQLIFSGKTLNQAADQSYAESVRDSLAALRQTGWPLSAEQATPLGWSVESNR